MTARLVVLAKSPVPGRAKTRLCPPLTPELAARVTLQPVEQLGVDEEEVTPQASFVEDLNADSLDLVELIMSLEEEFGMEISDEDAEKIQKVSDAVEFIEEHQQ